MFGSTLHLELRAYATGVRHLSAFFTAHFTADVSATTLSSWPFEFLWWPIFGG